MGRRASVVATATPVPTTVVLLSNSEAGPIFTAAPSMVVLLSNYEDGPIFTIASSK